MEIRQLLTLNVKIMKVFLLLFVISCSINGFAQADSCKQNNLSSTVFSNSFFSNKNKVQYNKKQAKSNELAWFINDQFVYYDTPMLKAYKTNIDTFYMKKEKVEFDGVKYNFSMHIKTKENYEPRIISLNELKDKHKIANNKPIIFIIDDKVISSDYDIIKLDEKTILKIYVDNVDNNKENIDVCILRIFTNTEENIERLQAKIRIRGTELAQNE